MKTPKQKLLDHLECYGWDAEEIDDEELEWWADEIWILKSHWSPNNLVAYVTALVDPQHDGLRKKGQAVWAYGLSEEYPKDQWQAQIKGTLSLGKSFKNEVEGFVDKIIALREARNA
jgi:hypothetical protein